MSIAVLFAGLMLLTLLHELGHAAVARAFRWHITVFSVGFGPPFARFVWGQTEVLFCVLPFGGFVRIAELVDDSLPRPSWARRASVALAGSGANYLVAAWLGVILTLGWGVDTGRVVGLEVTQVSEHAAARGLQVGDLVVSANDIPVRSVAELQRRFSAAGSEKVRLELVRDGRRERIEAAAAGGPGLGARYVPRPELAHLSHIAALGYGLADPYRRASSLLSNAGAMLARPGAQRPVSPVGIAARVAKSGRWDLRRILSFAATLSVMVALFNLLPIPGLDGGKLLLSTGEAVLRRRLRPRLAMALQLGGALLLVVAWLLLIAMDVLSAR